MNTKNTGRRAERLTKQSTDGFPDNRRASAMRRVAASEQSLMFTFTD